MTARDTALDAVRWVLCGTTFLSAVFIWRSAFDPFSLPKATVVVLGASAVAMMLLWRIIILGRIALPSSPQTLTAGLFVLALGIAVAASDNPSVSLTGIYKRYTGFVLYASCVVLFLAANRVFAERGLRWFAGSFVAAGAVTMGYGVLQSLGIEPYDWQNLYGDAAFSTLGNPNFAAAYAGISTPLALWAALGSQWPLAVRIAGCVTFFASVVTALATQSFQGPVTVAAGVAVFGLALLLNRGGRSARVGIPVAGVVVVLGAVAVASGLVGKGPASRLDDNSPLQLRRFYWGAAAEMFSENPLAGVGLDRYSSRYRAGRSTEAALKSVFNVSADNPHNVPLKMFAEGGVLLGGAYLAFVGVTAFALVRGLLRTRGPDLLLLGGFGGAWVAYQLQSLVSIDIAPLAVSHWLLAAGIGVVTSSAKIREVALPWELRVVGTGKRRRVAEPSSGRLIGAGVVVALVGVLSSWLVTRPLRADVHLQDAKRHIASGRQPQAIEAHEASTEVAPWEPTYWFQGGVALLNSGQEERALTFVEEAIERDPWGLEQVVTAARIASSRGDVDAAASWYERSLRIEPLAPEMIEEVARFKLQHGMPDEGVELVERMVELRPGNPGYLLLLGQAHLAAGDDRSAEEAFEAVLESDPQNIEAQNGLEEARG